MSLRRQAEPGIQDGNQIFNLRAPVINPGWIYAGLLSTHFHL